ncbi:MAG: glycoside hydrolase domain-containing protein, partial [bacterium]
ALGAMAIVAAGLTGFSGAWAAEAPAQVRTWTGAVSANWADAGNWSGGGAPGAADDVVIVGGKSQPVLDLTNGAVTIKSLTIGSKTAAATLTFTNGNVTDKILIVTGDVTVGTNGVLTHANETATGTAVGDETQRLGLEIGGNLTIGAGGAIRVAGCGYAKGAGPYKAVNSSGGVHGGEGGFTTWNGSGATSTPTYGSVTSPVTAGGGSGFGSAGGGVAVIRAVGRLTVGGVIDASGGGGNAGGGAGGSVNIRAGELLGNGSISAKGGDGVPSCNGGGAGGGRVAVALTQAATFGSVTMNAAGGAGGSQGVGYGAAGTIYLQGSGQAAGMLIVSNPPLAGVAGARTLIGPEVTGDLPADVRVLDRARYVVTRDTVAVLNNNSLWRHFEVQRCATVRTDDGKLETWDLQPLTGRKHTWPKVDPRPAASTAPSTLPPADWAGLAMDDSAWPRVRLPRPIPGGRSIGRGDGMRPQSREGATAAILLRGKFEVRNPAGVKSCRLSVDYVGGVVVTVNGKEVLRRHVPGDKPDLLALAEDYPKDVFASDACDRYAREISIPVALLRPGVNVLAIEVHAAPYSRAYVKMLEGADTGSFWEPIGLFSAQMTVSPAAAVVANVARPTGIRVWNCAPYDTVSVFDYGDPCESLRPVAIHAARNSVFSGRLMVSSDQAIKGLQATVSDLTRLRKSSSSSAKRSSSSKARVENEDDDEDEGIGGARLPASAIQVRYAVPVVTGAPPANASSPAELSGGRSSVAPHRFDGLLDAIPAEIPVSQAPAAPPETFRGRLERKEFMPGAVASLWFTVRVPREAQPGMYEGRVTISAQGLPPTNVPLRVNIGEWTLPDPKDFRTHNFAYNEPEVVAGLNGVPLWSDRHLELQGRSQALMVEAGSRQVFANLCPGALANSEGLVRWIKQPDGSYTHDFTPFDKYLDMVAKS